MSTLLTILAGNTLIAAILASVAWLVYRWGRSPAIAHVFWALALLKLITPPFAPVQVGWKFQPEKLFAEPRVIGDRAGAATPASQRVETAPRGAKAPAGAASGASARSRFTYPRIPCTWTTFAWSAGGIWLAGSVIVALRLAGRAWAFQRLLDRCHSPDGELSRRAWRLARQAGLSSAPRVVLVEALLSPMLWGVGRSTKLIFPTILKERLEDDETDSLLLHELGHYARGDHWVRVLELVCRVTLWWHPLVWLACRQVEEVEEHCCDAWVVARQTGRERSYAEALLATIDFLNEHPVLTPPIASGLGDARLLRGRLVQIMAGESRAEPSRLVKRIAWTCGLTLLLLHPALWASSPPRINSPVKRTSPPRTSVTTTTASPARLPSGSAAQRALPATASSVLDAVLPDPPWAPAPLFASANSPHSGYRLEARAGKRTKLVNVRDGWQVDLSNYRLTCTAFAPDGEMFFSGDEEGYLRQWECKTGDPINSWRGPLQEITSLHVSPDGMHLATGSRDGVARIYRIEDRNEIASEQWLGVGISCIRWSDDGKQLAIAVGGWSDDAEPALVVWDFANRTKSPPVDIGRRIGAIAWLKDANSLLAAGWDGQALVVDIQTGSMKSAVVRKDDVSAAAWSAECPLRLLVGNEEQP